MKSTIGRIIACGTAILLTSCALAPPGADQRTPSGPLPTPKAPPSTARATPSSPSVSSSPPREPRTASISVSGDLLWHNSLWSSASIDGGGRRDFAPQLAGIRTYISEADLAVCHEEVPLAPPGGPFTNYPMFSVPPEVAPAIAATGWDLCTTASNHSMDAGWDGLVRTLHALRDNSVLTSGTFETPEQSRTPVIFTTRDGVRIAVISQTYGLNGLKRVKGKEWSVNLLDAQDTLESAHRARAAGADIVAVHMHAGDEYSSAPNAQQSAFAKTVTASDDVDLVFGQHAHVVQPVDVVNGTWVFYGAGNLIAQSGPAKPRSYDGYIAKVTFTEQKDGSFKATAAEYAPTMITPLRGSTPARVHLVSDEIRRGSPIKDALEQSAARTRATVNALGVEGLTER